MEGGRLGRSSTRFGVGPSSAVFTGPVRKWKKRWVHIPPPAPTTNKRKAAAANTTTANNNGGSRLVLFKWTKDNHHLTTDSDPATQEEPLSPPPRPRRKFRYIPIALLEEQKFETADNEPVEELDNEEVRLSYSTNFTTANRNFKNAALEEKPDINDVPMDETQASGGKISRHDLNEEGTFDLSLG